MSATDRSGDPMDFSAAFRELVAAGAMERITSARGEVTCRATELGRQTFQLAMSGDEQAMSYQFAILFGEPEDAVQLGRALAARLGVQWVGRPAGSND
jgi:hypothetical protein